MHNPMIGRVTSHYDMGRKHPVFHTVQPHRGIDLGAPLGVKPWDYIGAPIRASYAGVVEAVCSTWKTGWGAIWGRSGNGVFIRNPDGEGQYYGHLNRVYVRKGQRVTKGEIIGEMGVTGNVTGPHLHFETHNRGSGSKANPNYTLTRDPMVDFRAANITPGVDPIVLHGVNKHQAAPATTITKDWLDMASEEDVRKIVKEETDNLYNRILAGIKWAKIGHNDESLRTMLHEARAGAQQGYTRIVSVSAAQDSVVHAVAEAAAKGSGLTPEEVQIIAQAAQEGAEKGAQSGLAQGVTLEATVKSKEAN